MGAGQGVPVDTGPDTNEKTSLLLCCPLGAWWHLMIPTLAPLLALSWEGYQGPRIFGQQS